jgi:predicted RNA-binding Zn-ribbon protein involved in translation (DUF1610 family)
MRRLLREFGNDEAWTCESCGFEFWRYYESGNGWEDARGLAYNYLFVCPLCGRDEMWMDDDTLEFYANEKRYPAGYRLKTPKPRAIARAKYIKKIIPKKMLKALMTAAGGGHEVPSHRDVIKTCFEEDWMADL